MYFDDEYKCRTKKPSWNRKKRFNKTNHQHIMDLCWLKYTQAQGGPSDEPNSNDFILVEYCVLCGKLCSTELYNQEWLLKKYGLAPKLQPKLRLFDVNKTPAMAKEIDLNQPVIYYGQRSSS